MTELEPINVISRWVKIEIHVFRGNDKKKRIKDFDAKFTVHGGSETKWVPSNRDGIVVFEMFSMNGTCKFSIRVKNTEFNSKRVVVDFLETQHNLSAIKNSMVLHFVLSKDE